MDDNQNEFDKEFLGEHVGNCRRCGEDVDLGQALFAQALGLRLTFKPALGDPTPTGL